MFSFREGLHLEFDKLSRITSSRLEPERAEEMMKSSGEIACWMWWVWARMLESECPLSFLPSQSVWAQNKELTRSLTHAETCPIFLTAHVRIRHVLGGYTRRISTRNNIRPANSHGFPVWLPDSGIISRSHGKIFKSHEFRVLKF